MSTNYARVSVIFQHFLHHFLLGELATSSIRVNRELGVMERDRALFFLALRETWRNHVQSIQHGSRD